MKRTWALGDRIRVKEKGHVDPSGRDLYGRVGYLRGFGNGHARVDFVQGTALIPYDALENVTKRPRKEDGHTPEGVSRPIGEQIAARQRRKKPRKPYELR